MLRNVILGACLTILACLVVATTFQPGIWPSAAMFALLTAAVAFEHARYRGRLAARPGEPFRPTAERFIDPESGAEVQVWANAAGERSYVEAPKPES